MADHRKHSAGGRAGENHLHSRHGEHHGFDPERLLALEQRRREFMPAEQTLAAFLGRDDLLLADVGCGTGFYALPAARMLRRGRVFAADLQQNMVDTTLRRAREAGLENIEGIVAPSSKLPLGDSSVDVVLLAMVFHDIGDQEETLAEVGRILRPAGRLCLVEWDRIETEFGPPMQIRIRPDELSAQLAAASFTVTELERSERQPALYFVQARHSPR